MAIRFGNTLGPIKGGAITATGTLSARPLQDRFADAVNVKDFGAVGDGVADDTLAIQAAIDAIALKGGGTIFIHRGVYKVTNTLLITDSNVSLVGDGGGHRRQGISSLRETAATRIVWGGSSTPPAGTALVHFQTPPNTQTKIGGGITNLMLDGNGGQCPIGLHVQTWRKARFDRLVCYGFGNDQFLLSVVDYALSIGPADNQRNYFVSCFASTFGGSGWYLTNTAYGYRLTGGTATHSGNTSFNVFHDCDTYMSKGIAWMFENTDNNYLFGCSGGAAYRDPGSYDLVFGSSDQDTGFLGAAARYNSVVSCQFRVLAMASQVSGGTSSWGNLVMGGMESNGVPSPVLQRGANGAPDARLTYQTSGTADISSEIQTESLLVRNFRDDNTVSPALFLRKDKPTGNTGDGLAKIQWRMTNDAGQQNIDAGRINAGVTSAVAGQESASIGVWPMFEGNNETQASITFRDGVAVPNTIEREVSSISIAGGVATVITSVNHGFVSNNEVIISGATPAGLNATHIIAVSSPTTFTFATGETGTVTGTITATLKNIFTRGFGTVNTAVAFWCGDKKILGPRKTGWSRATGTATRTAFDTATATTEELAERVKALIDDLHGTGGGHGLIGA